MQKQIDEEHLNPIGKVSRSAFIDPCIFLYFKDSNINNVVIQDRVLGTGHQKLVIYTAEFCS